MKGCAPRDQHTPKGWMWSTLTGDNQQQDIWNTSVTLHHVVIKITGAPIHPVLFVIEYCITNILDIIKNSTQT